MSSGTTELPCICCAERINIKRSCRNRGGTASLCGTPEWTSPSTPPKKYLTRSVVGDVCVLGWSAPPDVCSGNCGNVSRRTWSGECETDPTNCTETNSFELLQGVQVVPTCDCSAVVQTVAPQPACDLVPPGGVIFTTAAGGTGNYTDIANQINWTRTYAGNCEGPLGVCPGINCSMRQTIGSMTLALADEDTDENAIARLLAGDGGIWSDWTLVGDGTGDTCLPWVCCLADWQSRTTGFDIDYHEAQVRLVNYPLSLEGLTAYEIKVDIYRRVQGSSGTFLLYQTLTYPETTDIDGDFPAFDIDVPNDEGFETYAGAAYAILSP